MPTEACMEELETLSAIFLDDLTIKETPAGGATLLIVLYPATGDDEESRYVTLTLEIELTSSYPETLPKILFRNPRGLSDIMLSDMEQKMNIKCEELKGDQMVFELIDMAKEFLTSNNRPASECPICLLSFTEYDVFFRSDCFHHFHSYCLGKYLQSLEQKEAAMEELLPHEPIPAKACPVCREELPKTIVTKFLLEAPPPSEETKFDPDNAQAVLSEWSGKRDSMNKLFMKQKSQGGIIDLSDKYKNLLVISSPTRNQSLLGQDPVELTAISLGVGHAPTNSQQPIRVTAAAQQQSAANRASAASQNANLGKTQPTPSLPKLNNVSKSSKESNSQFHGDSSRYPRHRRRYK